MPIPKPPPPAPKAQWWYILIGNSVSPKLGDTFQIAELAQAPASGSSFGGGIVISVKGPYASRAAAETANGTAGSTTGSASTGAGHPRKPFQPLSGLAAIGNFFNVLGEASTWLRLAKIGIGGTLIIMGINKLSGGKITKVGEVAGKAAVL